MLLQNLPIQHNISRLVAKPHHFTHFQNPLQTAAQNQYTLLNQHPQFFAAWLDSCMHMSCASFSTTHPDNLHLAYQRQLYQIIQQLHSRACQNVLDLNAHWGCMLEKVLAAGIDVHAVTTTAAQLEFCYSRIQQEFMPANCNLSLAHQELPSQRFDAIISLDQLEYIPYSSQVKFIEIIKKHTQRHGTVILQTYIQTPQYQPIHLPLQLPTLYPIDQTALHQHLKKCKLEVEQIYNNSHYQCQTIQHWIKKLIQSEHHLNDQGINAEIIQKWQLHLALQHAQLTLGQLQSVQLHIRPQRKF